MGFTFGVDCYTIWHLWKGNFTQTTGYLYIRIADTVNQAPSSLTCPALRRFSAPPVSFFPREVLSLCYKFAILPENKTMSFMMMKSFRTETFSNTKCTGGKNKHGNNILPLCLKTHYKIGLSVDLSNISLAKQSKSASARDSSGIITLMIWKVRTCCDSF